MKILFSVYYEDRNTGTKELHFSNIIETEMSNSQIHEHLKLYDRFHSVLEAGKSLAFLDIYCFGDYVCDVVDKVRTIPQEKSKLVTTKEPSVMRIENYNPGNSDVVFYPATDDYYFYRVSRYECGASGFSSVIAYIQKDPILATIIFELLKGIAVKLFTFLFSGKYTKKRLPDSQTIYFHTKRFYREFCKMTNTDRFNCQIVGLQRLKTGKFKVKVRTLKGEVYEVKANHKGKIYSLKLN